MQRRTFFNPLELQFPVGALCSFAHRVSGVALALISPFAAWIFVQSLASANGYDRAIELLHSTIGRIALVFLGWALAHHAAAGVRHLLLDLDVGSRLRDARRSAALVLVIGALGAVAALAGVR